MTLPLCRHCNEPESEHHVFEAVPDIPGCVCADLWNKPERRGPICATFTRCSFAGDDDWCECHHLRECHGGTE